MFPNLASSQIVAFDGSVITPFLVFVCCNARWRRFLIALRVSSAMQHNKQIPPQIQLNKMIHSIWRWRNNDNDPDHEPLRSSDISMIAVVVVEFSSLVVVCSESMEGTSDAAVDEATIMGESVSVGSYTNKRVLFREKLIANRLTEIPN